MDLVQQYLLYIVLAFHIQQKEQILHHFLDEIHEEIFCLGSYQTNDLLYKPSVFLPESFYSFGRDKSLFQIYSCTVLVAWEFPGRCSFGSVSKYSISRKLIIYTY